MLKKILMIGMSFAIMSGAFAETAAPTVNQDKEKEERIRAFAQSINIDYEQKKDSPFVFDEKDSTNYEVLYFFSYSCPHCYEFKDYKNEWLKQKQDDVAFHAIPVSFQDNWEITAKGHIIAEQLKLNNFEKTIYDRINRKGYKINKMDDLRDLMSEEYSIDSSVFNSLYNSLDTELKLEKYTKITDELEVMGTPSIVVITKNNKVYLTSPSIAKGTGNTIFSTEFLMMRDRKQQEGKKN